MKTIASFTVDHDVLQKGMYTSRIDGDVVTYDIRMVTPNTPPYLENAAMHTFEHLFATYVRNSPYTDEIVYVGPMGCRTGFYFLCRTGLAPATAISLIKQCFAFIAAFEGTVPGTTSSTECGNYLEHDLPGAKAIALDMCRQLECWNEPMLAYEWHYKKA